MEMSCLLNFGTKSACSSISSTDRPRTRGYPMARRPGNRPCRPRMMGWGHLPCILARDVIISLDLADVFDRMTLPTCRILEGVHGHVENHFRDMINLLKQFLSERVCLGEDLDQAKLATDVNSLH